MKRTKDESNWRSNGYGGPSPDRSEKNITMMETERSVNREWGIVSRGMGFII